ncbi:response regulator transcription factor [Paenibacillus riograndensis]|uniref:Uncharacterized protein n=1 Tax=Paenibacillus riograndensis SBR5 TaxID=1073571 RepID=A0A0E4HEF3_9BACL|nr:response regulator transcription factor [Paenibacillus riograndensis]CQR58709.1 hypothetical protein PRIO_6362 [Paenibacillus riograndensis SBR5]
MLKLLIVDDDKWIREGLRANVNWSREGIEVVATAANGEEGWELVQKLRPDILLTDIQMPLLDGLQLAEKVNERYALTKIIFLTGYDDFSYAKKALDLQASGYILKYEDNEVILQSVAGTGNNLRREKRELEKARKSQSLIENKFFADLLSGVPSVDWARREMELLGIQSEGPYFRVAVIQPEDLQRFSRPGIMENTELLLFSIQNICAELFTSRLPKPFFVPYNHRINIIFNLADTDGASSSGCSLATLLEDIRHTIETCLKIPVSIGVGTVCEGFGQIPQSYNKALTAAHMKDVAGRPGLFFCDELSHSQHSHHTLLKQMESYIHKNYADENLSLAAIAGEIHISPSYVSTLFKKYREINVIEYVIRIRMEKAAELLKQTDCKSYEISEKVGYGNPQYFSVLFKKHFGMSPSDYRKSQRDELSKKTNNL